MLCAIINNNVIEQIKELTEEQYVEQARTCQLIMDISNENPTPLVGWQFNGNSIVVPAGYRPSVKITRLAFFNRFTNQELATFYSVAAQNVAYQILRDKLMMATFIDLNREDTGQALDYLVMANIITAQRKTEILTTTPTAIEQYKE